MTAMYLQCLSEEMPVQNMVFRHASNGFKPEYKTQYYAQYIWLNYKAEIDNVFISTKQNMGIEAMVANYRVDGMARLSNGQMKCYEYLGCQVHCHNGCRYAKNSDPELWTRTLEREQYLRKRGYQYESIWACEFWEMVSDLPQLREAVKRFKPEFLMNNRGRVS